MRARAAPDSFRYAPYAGHLRLAASRPRGYNEQMQPPPASAVRAWARAQGLPVGDRGRLSPDLVDAYLAEQGAPAPAPNAPPAPAARPTSERWGTVSGTTVRARGPWNWPALEGRPPPTGVSRTRKASPPVR